MASGHEQLPNLLARIAEVAGEEAALLVAKEWGGQPLYVPQEVTPGHRLVQVLGRLRAEKVAAALGYGEIVVPLGPYADDHAKRMLIRRPLADGLPQHIVARKARVHLRTVEREAQRMRTEKQLPLFE